LKIGKVYIEKTTLYENNSYEEKNKSNDEELRISLQNELNSGSFQNDGSMLNTAEEEEISQEKNMNSVSKAAIEASDEIQENTQENTAYKVNYRCFWIFLLLDLNSLLRCRLGPQFKFSRGQKVRP
jgi:hypothetical protein